MAYRYDKDLEFLVKIKSKELDDLVYCLTHDKDGIKRLTEELTLSESYKKYYPNHNKYWELIAAEIQCFGANSFATLFRGGKGVLYREVLKDVCDKLKVNYNKESSIETIENNLLLKILRDTIDNMSPEERKNLANEFNIDSTSYTTDALIMAFQAIFKAGGFKSYQLTVIVANAVFRAIFGKGLTLAANATLVKVASILTGPIGWVIMGTWSLVDVAGPAYRVTLPAVIQIALLRKSV